MRKRTSISMIALLTLLACVVGFNSAPTAQAVEGKEIRIGVAVPITGHGANVGKREAIGAQAAVDVINAAGGVNGVPLKLYIEDTASNPQEAVNAVRKLAGDHKVIAIVGPHYSSVAETTFPLGNQLKIVQVAVASSKPGLAAANRPYAFRNTLTEDKIAGAVVREFKKKYNIEKVAIMVDIKDAVSRAVGTLVLPPAFNAYKVNILTGKDPVTFQTNDTQFKAQITKLKAMGPDGVGLGALGPDALNIITEARRQGMKQPFMSTAPIMEGELPEKGGKAVEGTFSGTIWQLSIATPESQKFIDAYKKRAETMYSSPFTETPDYYPVNAYDAVFMMVEAIQKKGVTNKPGDLEKDREKVMTYFTTLRDFKGVASKGFNEVGDGIKDVHVFEIKNGRWEPVVSN
ncbi:MAG: ABC transporter substrate-binding protein [Deltaproteobacteria bacterium]|nr:MAG: ABC transporter substrate-binding protein [Deltaproteobacteria bacterium]